MARRIFDIEQVGKPSSGVKLYFKTVAKLTARLVARLHANRETRGRRPQWSGLLAASAREAIPAAFPAPGGRREADDLSLRARRGNGVPVRAPCDIRMKGSESSIPGTP